MTETIDNTVVERDRLFCRLSNNELLEFRKYKTGECYRPKIGKKYDDQDTVDSWMYGE